MAKKLLNERERLALAEDPPPEPEPQPEPIVDDKPISLRTESQDGKIVDNTYMAPCQRNYELHVSESNPRGVH